MWGQPVNLETTDGRYALFLNCTGFTINNFHKKSKYFIASNQLLSIAASLSSIFLIISSQYEVNHISHSCRYSISFFISWFLFLIFVRIFHTLIFLIQ